MDRQTFTSLVERTRQPLRRFLAALCCGDTAMADDLAQDTYMRAYLSADSCRDISRFDRWLFAIAYRNFLTACRSRRPDVPLDDARQLMAPDSSDSTFRYQDLYDALASISERERTALLLFYMQGYAINEIAEITGTSSEAVKQQLSRGRNHLRTRLSR
ncbi:MAG: RNA polymerase sigma factor [Duncaniella sp.]|nr:RNA polymerase sigma factor [Duncaniella sp.]